MDVDENRVQYEQGWADGRANHAMPDDATERYSEGYKDGTAAAIAAATRPHGRHRR